MKLPEIKSTNKIRDTYICLMYLEGKTQAEIAEDKRVNLSQAHVGRILYKHRDVLVYDKNYEKVKRVNQLKRILKDAPPSKKDVTEVIDQIRNEIEGQKLEVTGKGLATTVNVFPNKTIVFQDITPDEYNSSKSPDGSESPEGNRVQEQV